MYYSEFQQDQFVAELLKKDYGVFVEFGALDGLLHSNTLHFEERGWDGVLIEANPAIFQQLEQNRPKALTVNAAVYDHEGIVEFERISGGYYGWSGIKDDLEPEHIERIQTRIDGKDREVIEVPCRTLDSILTDAAITDIDYMSVDVEGAELKILEVFPFEKYRIALLGVEDNFGRPRLDLLLRSKGFEFVGKCGPDRMYRHPQVLRAR